VPLAVFSWRMTMLAIVKQRLCPWGPVELRHFSHEPAEAYKERSAGRRLVCAQSMTSTTRTPASPSGRKTFCDSLMDVDISHDAANPRDCATHSADPEALELRQGSGELLCRDRTGV
jgi:hypothetical protein